jgi:competence protein ComEA
MDYAENIISKGIKSLFQKNLIELIFIIISIFCFSGALYLFFTSIKSVETNKIPLRKNIVSDEEIKENNPTKSENNIIVDISGAVSNPGAYEIKENSRLTDLIKKAGGLSNDADKQFFARNFNLAKIVTDGEKIYIPSSQEVKQGLFKETINILTNQIKNNLSNNQILGVNTAKININTATMSELDSLPGVGQVTAQKIIDGRPYSTLEDLIQKKIVNKGVWEKIKDKITN